MVTGGKYGLMLQEKLLEQLLYQKHNRTATGVSVYQGTKQNHVGLIKKLQKNSCSFLFHYSPAKHKNDPLMKKKML